MYLPVAILLFLTYSSNSAPFFFFFFLNVVDSACSYQFKKGKFQACPICKTDRGQLVTGILLPFLFMHFIYYFYLFIYFNFWPCCVACGILVPQPGIEPAPLAVKAESPNHWATRESPLLPFLSS